MNIFEKACELEKNCIPHAMATILIRHKNNIFGKSFKELFSWKE